MATNSHELQAYGIDDERSDLRVHVCPKVQRLYIFRTDDARLAIYTGQYKLKTAYQKDILTARGYVVPWDDIPNIAEHVVDDSVWDVACFQTDMTTTEKGEAAALVAQAFFQTGKIRFVPVVEVVQDYSRQLAGQDLVIRIMRRVQVKCDYNGGRRDRGGTGNLFIQTEEANPFSRH